MKIQQNALGKVNRAKEIRRREKDGLEMTDNSNNASFYAYFDKLGIIDK